VLSSAPPGGEPAAARAGRRGSETAPLQRTARRRAYPPRARAGRRSAVCVSVCEVSGRRPCPRPRRPPRPARPRCTGATRMRAPPAGAPAGERVSARGAVHRGVGVGGRRTIGGCASLSRILYVSSTCVSESSGVRGRASGGNGGGGGAGTEITLAAVPARKHAPMPCTPRAAPRRQPPQPVRGAARQRLKGGQRRRAGGVDGCAMRWRRETWRGRGGAHVGHVRGGAVVTSHVRVQGARDDSAHEAAHGVGHVVKTDRGRNLWAQRAAAFQPPSDPAGGGGPHEASPAGCATC